MQNLIFQVASMFFLKTNIERYNVQYSEYKNNDKQGTFIRYMYKCINKYKYIFIYQYIVHMIVICSI